MIDNLKLLRAFMKHQPPSDLEGVYSSFYPIDAEWGVKAFDEKSDRDSAVRKQKKVAAVGLAPKTGKCFKYSTYNGRYDYHCYVTERVIPLASPDYRTREERRVIKKYPNILLQIDTIIKDIKTLTGIKYEDAHFANFGWLRGKLVAIDFRWPSW